MKILRKFLDSLKNIVLKTTLDDNWINEYYASNYFDSVKFHIALLRNSLEDPKFERGQDEFLRDITRSYEKEYCPCTLYNYFNFENKYEYCCLRSEIDELLHMADEDAVR